MIASDSIGTRVASQPEAKRNSALILNASRVGNKGGLLTFTIALLECLSKLYAEIEAVVPDGVEVPYTIKGTRIPKWLGSSSRVSRLRPIFWMFYSTFFFPSARGRKILCSTHHVLPFRRNQVVTVHDVRPYHEPDSWVQHFYFKHMLPRGLRKCDGILTVSKTSRHEIATLYGIAAEKIHVVSNAISLPDIKQTTISTASLPQDAFLLMVGASWKHKNALELLDNHSLWSDRYKLKIVAGRGQYTSQLQSKIRELGIEANVELIHDLDEISIRTLYMECSALIYPSTMEGFGLPPLEAMAYGRPVIASDIPVFRELFGEIPLFVRLKDSTSWAAAFCSLQQVTATPNHWRLSAGRALAATYSIDRMQAELSAALEAIWKL